MDTLSVPERDVLEVLAEGRTAISVVALAADLYDRDGKDDRFTFGDPIGFVTWLLEHLNVEGYLTYRLEAHARADDVPFRGLPFHIRLTRKGWETLGFTHTTIEVGTRGAHRREVRMLDRTDYRTHSDIAEGGPTDHHLWWQCPDPPPSQEYRMSDLMTRPYIRVTPEMEERVVASYGRTGSYEKTAHETNLDIRRVRYIVNDRPRLGRDSSSLKERTLELIREKGPYVDALALHKDLPGPHGLHNLVHILHSLNKARLIEFRTDRQGGATNYLNIRVREDKANGTSVPYAGLTGEDAREYVRAKNTQKRETKLALTSGGTETEGESSRDVSPEGGDIPRPETESIESEANGEGNYPELVRLRAASLKQTEGRAKAEQYIKAAEAVADIDPDMAESLLSKAGDVDGALLNPVEQEYLRYAETHPEAAS